MNHVNGLHHVTAVAGQPQQNYDFYSGLLGLRLVKQTVNPDDPSTYQLFYGDLAGTPGTILSFFTDARMEAGAPDTGEAIAISFSISADSISFWVDYLSSRGVDVIEPFERFGKKVIGFRDPDGLHLELMADPEVPNKKRPSSGSIPDDHAIRGLHGVTLAEENYQATGQLLQESLGFKETAKEHDRILYQSSANFGGAIELVNQATLNGKPGAGTVHHTAFRANNETGQTKVRKGLQDIGYHVTEIEDRHYFKSCFFYEPGGALFEVATGGPGFSVDEYKNALGQRLCLPPRLEEKRSLIEADLPDLNL